MTCENKWTFRFPNVPGRSGPFEISPYTLDFTRSRSEFAYAKAKFDREVGRQVKPQTRKKSGHLRTPTLVDVLHNGNQVYTLYFEPDFARYEDRYTYLEFHDLQKSMDSGVIDKQWDGVKLRDAYKYVFEKRPYKDLITGIKFTTPEDVKAFGTSHFISDTLDGVRIKQFDGFRDEIYQGVNPNEVRTIEQDGTQRLVDSYYAVNIDKQSPLQAIYNLNNTFRVTSWIDKDRKLWVGSPESFGRYHIAAPNDKRVWRYSSEEVNIRHPRNPVGQVVVEGAWLDEPGVGEARDAVEEVVSWFTDRNTENGGLADVLAQGVAYRTDINDGETMVVSNTNAARDALPEIAESVMRNKMKHGHAGQIEINTDLSSDITLPETAKPGDFIHVVPDDKHFSNPTKTSGQVGDEPDDLGDCGSFVNNELYVVTETQQSVGDSGQWTLTLDVTMYPDNLTDNMESELRFFEPESEEFLTEAQVFDGKIIEGDGSNPDTTVGSP